MRKKGIAGGIYVRYVKRIADVVLCAMLVFLLLLPMLVIVVAIRADSEGRAIFKQRRRGRGGREFICYKFRTMYTDAPAYSPAASFEGYERYVTRVGGFLRKTSLDELPQLFNVLKGDMSLVGPRPLICEEEHIHEQRMRAGVYFLRPGITGMAQVNGRKRLDDDEKLRNDRYYLSNVRLGLDFRILCRTFSNAIKREELENNR